jgi:hypothetical protein
LGCDFGPKWAFFQSPLILTKIISLSSPTLKDIMAVWESLSEEKKIKKFDVPNGGQTNVVILRVPITNYNCLVGFWTFCFFF